MYYRIAEITLYSEFRMHSFEAFSCDPAPADVILKDGGAVPSDGKELKAGVLKVSRVSDGWFLQPAGTEGAGLITSEDYTRLCLAGEDAAIEKLGTLVEWLVRVALECFLVRRGYVSLHAAAVEAGGKAYAFSGPSGIGKSTRAEAWLEASPAQLISGDRPMIHVDTLTLYGVPWDGKERCYRNVCFPLEMICEVRRSQTEYVRAMSFDQRRRLLVRQCFLPMWDTETSALQLVNIANLARKAQIVRVFCGPSPEDAKNLQRILSRGEWEKELPDMKAKEGFVLRSVSNDYILMPAGENAGRFNGTVVLNDVAAFVWKMLENPVSREDLLLAVMDAYNVEEAVAARDLDALLQKLNAYGVIEDEG